MWWMSGIFRSVDLLLRPAGGIHDLATVTDFDPATGTGTVEVTVHGADGAPIEATLEVPALDLREDVGPGTVTLEALKMGHARNEKPTYWSTFSPSLRATNTLFLQNRYVI